MNDNIFLDSNILVYCYSTTEVVKQATARSLMLLDNVFISTQVLNETANVLHKKYTIPWLQLADLIADFENNFLIHNLTAANTKTACLIAQRYMFSLYDSLIISAALDCNCSILYSEDMTDGLLIDGKLKIANPFK